MPKRVCCWQGMEALVAQKCGPRVPCAELLLHQAQEAQESAGQTIPHLGLLSGAVRVQIHRDFGQPKEQFVNRRQDYFYLETLCLLATALVMPLPVLVPGTSSTRCMRRAGGCSSSAERTPNLRASAFQDPAAGLGMGQLLKCQGGAQE